MVPKLFPAGKSFSGVARYLAHDPEKALTAERVDWTHTVNLANDHIPSAVHEMLWTYRAADRLKQEAGLGAGGRRLEKPAKHFSLNWHPSERPDRAHMIETVRSFLKHMGWHEHQAILVAHKDKQPHVHVLVNAVHPETGRALNTSFEKRRAQEWALEYERKHELIFCEERLKPKEERTPSPTRATWEKLRQSERQFEKEEAARAAKTPHYFERADPALAKAKEWDALKAHQRGQREQFFVGGKQAYRGVRNAIFREVRTEFRADWRRYYKAAREKKLSPFQLGKMKAGILARQNAELDTRRNTACGELREQRDEIYKNLLEQQKKERAWLTARQKDGLRSPELLDLIYGELSGQSAETEKRKDRSPLQESFRKAAREVCAEDELTIEPERQPRDVHAKEHHKVRDPANALGDLGMGAIGALAEIGERLFDGLLGGTDKARAPDMPKPIATRAREQNDASARATEKQQRSAEEQASEAEQLQAYWEERRHRRRSRDRD